MDNMSEIDWDAVFWDQMPRLYNFFRYRIGDNTVAEDLTAQTFEKAWQARQQYRRDLGAFSQWLFGIARHLAIDHLRQKRPTILPLDSAENIIGQGSVEFQIEHAQNVAHLQRLLSGLSEREQEIIALKFGADLTNRAIANVLDLSETNIGTLIHRTIAKLRTKWEVVLHE